jgi:hypothetical protein
MIGKDKLSSSETSELDGIPKKAWGDSYTLVTRLIRL